MAKVKTQPQFTKIQYILKPWQIIDLFCQMIAEYESIPVAEITKKGGIDDKLKKYQDKEEADKFADKAFKPIADDLGIGYQYYPTVLKEFSLVIRQNIPKVIAENRLRIILIYIKKIKKIKKGKFDIYETGIEEFKLYERIDPPKKNNRLLLFEESTWFLYYGGETYFNFIPSKEFLTVCRVVLRLNAYGYMTIYAMTSRKEEPIEPMIYKGQYYIRGDRYLFVEGRVNNERELRIMLDTEKVFKKYEIGDVLLGYYSNASSNIVYGPIIIEKVSNSVALDSKIFTSPSQVISGEQVHPAIWGALDKGAKFRLPTRPNLHEGTELVPLKKDDLYDLFDLIKKDAE